MSGSHVLSRRSCQAVLSTTRPSPSAMYHINPICTDEETQAKRGHTAGKRQSRAWQRPPVCLTPDFFKSHGAGGRSPWQVGYGGLGCPAGAPCARWAQRWEKGPSEPFRLHNPHIVDSLGNFPGSTSCWEGGEMSDGGGWGLWGPLGGGLCRPALAGAKVVPGQVSSFTLWQPHLAGTPQGSKDSEGQVQALPPGPGISRCLLPAWPHCRLVGGEGPAGPPRAHRSPGPPPPNPGPAELGQQGEREALSSPWPPGWPIKAVPLPINRQPPCAVAPLPCPPPPPGAAACPHPALLSTHPGPWGSW